MDLNVRRLSDEEVVRMFPKRGQMDLSEYEAIFEGAEPGNAFVVELDGLSPRAMKRRLGQAVKRAMGQDAKLRWRPADENGSIAFEIRPFSTAEKTHRRGRRREAVAV